MATQQSPYVTSTCVPQCIPKDAAYLKQSMRRLCYHDAVIDTPVPRRVAVSNLNSAAKSTRSLTAADAGTTFVLSDAGQVNTITLPASTGENRGLTFNFVVAAASATNSHIIKVGPTADRISGSVVIASTAPTSNTGGANGVGNGKIVTAGTSDTQINLNKTTSGNKAGDVGSTLSFVAIEKGKWQVNGVLITAQLGTGNTGASIFT